MTETETPTPKYPNIRYEPNYRGHWNGPAWLSGHPYGVQVHRDLTDAERWVEGQRKLGGSRWHGEDCIRCNAAEFGGNHRYWRADTPETYGPYRAFNGHLMLAPVWGVRRDGSLDYSQSGAYCADDCGACAGGESLPDW